MLEREEITVREATPGDGLAIVEAFNRVYCASGAQRRPRTLAGWNWRYRENPAGAQAMIAVDPAGRVLAQYAGLGLAVRVGGQVERVSQAVDSFCDPAQRGGLARAGLFVRTGRPYARSFGADGAGSDLLMYGLPVAAAWRTGHDHLGYRVLSPLWRLERPVSVQVQREAQLEVRSGTVFPDGVDDLFERWAAGREAVVVRDRGYLRWRYERHPERHYRILSARRHDALVGWMVLLEGELDGVEGTWVLDHLTLDGETGEDATRTQAVLRALLDRAAAQATGAGRSRLCAVAGDLDPDLVTFQGLGFRVRPTGYVIAGRTYRRRLDLAWWAGHLRLSLGEMDVL